MQLLAVHKLNDALDIGVHVTKLYMLVGVYFD